MCDETKNCSRCKGDLPIEQFRKRFDKRSNSTYYNSTCRTCDNAISMENHEKRKNDPVYIEKQNKRSAKYRLLNAELIKQQNKETHTYKNPRFKKWRQKYIKKNNKKIQQQEVITKKRYHEKNRDNLTDKYIIKLLCSGYSMEKTFVIANPHLIEEHRAKVKAEREQRAAQAIERLSPKQEINIPAVVEETGVYRFISVPVVYSKYKNVKVNILALIDSDMASASVYSGRVFIKIDTVEIKNLR